MDEIDIPHASCGQNRQQNNALPCHSIQDPKLKVSCFGYPSKILDGLSMSKWYRHRPLLRRLCIIVTGHAFGSILFQRHLLGHELHLSKRWTWLSASVTWEHSGIRKGKGMSLESEERLEFIKKYLTLMRTWFYVKNPLCYTCILFMTSWTLKENVSLRKLNKTFNDDDVYDSLSILQSWYWCCRQQSHYTIANKRMSEI